MVEITAYAENTTEKSVDMTGWSKQRIKYHTDPVYRQECIDKTKKWFTDRYRNDEEFRGRVKGYIKKSNAKNHQEGYNPRTTNPVVIKMNAVRAYVTQMNLRHKAQIPIQQTDKYNEYQIYFDEIENRYKSKLPLKLKK
jgi:hypothetical protein